MRGLIAFQLDALLGELLTAEQRQQAHQWIVEGAARVEPQRVR